MNTFGNTETDELEEYIECTWDDREVVDIFGEELVESVLEAIDEEEWG